jgi:hypothetical protein
MSKGKCTMYDMLTDGKDRKYETEREVVLTEAKTKSQKMHEKAHTVHTDTHK